MDEMRDYQSIWTYLRTLDFNHGFVDVDGVKTRYIHAGNSEAPALIMLHGTGGSWETFCKNLEAHAAHFNCFALDMVGNGFSAKPDIDYEIPFYVEHVRKFMRVMKLESASLVGVSLGAWVAAKLASLHPDLVEKLTLVAAAGLIANKETMQRIRSQRSKATGAPTWDSVKAIFQNLLHDQNSLFDDLVAVRLAFYRLPEAARAMAHILCLQDYDVRIRNLLPEDKWRDIKTPTLVFGAVEHDDDYLKTAQRISRLMPNVRYVEMSGVNHWAHFEKPNEFNRMNIEFLTST